MASKRETIRVALKPPAEQTSASGDTYWIFVSSDGKRKFVCFDDKLIPAWTTAKLEGVEHDYVVTPPSDPKRDAVIVAVPGVFEKPKGGGGGGRPMFTDRQVAGLIAAILGRSDTTDLPSFGFVPGTTVSLADGVLAWLENRPVAAAETPTRPAPGPATSTEGASAAATGNGGHMDDPAGAVERYRHQIVDLLGERFAGDVAKIKQFMRDKFGPEYRNLESLGENDLRVLRDELVAEARI